MKVIIRVPGLPGLALGLQRTLLAVASLSLGYVAWVLTDTWLYQQQQEQLLTQLRQPAAASARPVEGTLGPGGVIGRLQIPRLGLSVMVAEGVGGLTLRRAVGHISGTPLPGEMGNTALSGHRDTFFRPLRNVLAQDLITVTTPQGEYRYRVVSTRVVDPSEIGVLDSGPTEVLTLITCYPFYFVGAAPQRFIVRAQRIS